MDGNNWIIVLTMAVMMLCDTGKYIIISFNKVFFVHYRQITQTLKRDVYAAQNLTFLQTTAVYSLEQKYCPKEDLSSDI